MEDPLKILSDLLKKEHKELKYLIGEFYRLEDLKKIAEHAKKSKNRKEFEVAMKKEFRHLRGIFGVQRMEYRMARAYSRMKTQLEEKVIGEPNFRQVFPEEIKKMLTLIRQADVYNARIEKLESRGGDLQKVIRESEKDPKKIKAVMDDLFLALQGTSAFVEILKGLVQITEGMYKKIKG